MMIKSKKLQQLALGRDLSVAMALTVGRSTIFDFCTPGKILGNPFPWDCVIVDVLLGRCECRWLKVTMIYETAVEYLWATKRYRTQ